MKVERVREIHESVLWRRRLSSHRPDAGPGNYGPPVYLLYSFLRLRVHCTTFPLCTLSPFFLISSTHAP